MTHKERYPEQYSHELCGKLVAVRFDGYQYRVARVVPSMFGLLATPKGGGTAYKVSDVSEVTA